MVPLFPCRLLAQPSFCALYVAVVLGYVYLAGKKSRRGKAGSGLALCCAWGSPMPCPTGAPLLGLLHYAALLLAAQYWTLCAAGRLFETGENIKLAFARFVQCRRHFALGQFYAPARRALGGGKAAGRPPEKCAQQRAEGRGGKTRVCGAGRRAGGVFVPLPCASAADAGRRGVCRPCWKVFTAVFQLCGKPVPPAEYGHVFAEMDVCPAHGAVFYTALCMEVCAGGAPASTAGRRCAAFSAGCACCRAPRWPRPCACCVRHMCCSLPCRPDICSVPSGARFRRAFPMRNMQGRAFSSCAGWRL